jgi:hypothetical protein
MAQGLPHRRVRRRRDRDHVTTQTVPDLRILGLVLFLFLTLLAILSAPLSAQSRAEVQVAARVVSTEPSRQALALATLPGAQPRRSHLATVRVARAGTGNREGTAQEKQETPDRRLVSIDFLRN